MTRQASVLLVDDRPANLLTLEAVLEPLDLNLVRATSGEEALKQVLKDDFAVILMDVQMPGLDGFETVTYIKQLEKTRHIPIIFITAISKEAPHVFKGYEVGAVDYLPKPFHPSVLRSKVSVFVDLYQKTAALAESEKRLLAVNLDLQSEVEQRKTAMESLADSESRLRAVFESSAIGIIVSDMDGRFLQVNPAFEEMVGYRGHELAKMRFTDVTHPEDVATDWELFTELAEGKRSHYEMEERYLHKDGETVWALMTRSVIRDAQGVPRFPIGLAQDITERKKLEAARDTFIADAAHELRTPLTTLTGFTDLLSMRKELSEEDVDRCVDALQRQGIRLRSLVNNLLDLTRLQRGGLKVELASVPLAPLVKEAVDALPVPEGRSLVSNVADDLVVVIDPLRFDQVITNLITNAYRYGGPNVRIDAQGLDGTIEINVTDDGKGVPPRFVPKLFEPFARGDNGAGVDGSGLGLAIAHMLTAACGGSLRYEENSPQGARFVIALQKP
ncbi:MAG: PAS domain S-box protein [Actinomycetota bacterium]|nr:PAS domain S-box protein [Actinomycetota bacterium]